MQESSIFRIFPLSPTSIFFYYLENWNIRKYGSPACSGIIEYLGYLIKLAILYAYTKYTPYGSVFSGLETKHSEHYILCTITVFSSVKGAILMPVLLRKDV